MGRKRQRSRGDSSGLVSRRAVLGVLLTGGAAAAGVQGTGAFSTVTGDRQFSVGTADDDNALLGIDPRDPTGTSGDAVALFTVTNRFSEALTLEQVGVVDAGSLGIARTDLRIDQWTLQPGESTDIDAQLSCASGATDDVELSIRAVTTDRDESIELTRSTTVTCETNGGACLTETEIEREDETISCIDITVQGRETDVSIDLSDVIVTGSVRVEIRGAGNSEIEIEIEDTTIRGDLIVDIRGAGGADIDIELEENAIEGTVDVPGYDDVGNGQGARDDDDDDNDDGDGDDDDGDDDDDDGDDGDDDDD
ncbi:hypothetical protein [Halorubrum pallidum]|uniref:Uncharacterized protein n=1 Tax=Halorubrum pallidum TaxID=1526114 RepID=A0ABD5SZP3_9EURY